MDWLIRPLWIAGGELVYYDREVKRRYPLQNLAMTAAVVYLGLVYLTAALFGGGAA